MFLSLHGTHWTMDVCRVRVMSEVAKIFKNVEYFFLTYETFYLLI